MIDFEQYISIKLGLVILIGVFSFFLGYAFYDFLLWFKKEKK